MITSIGINYFLFSSSSLFVIVNFLTKSGNKMSVSKKTPVISDN
jgi:hypothetical protein